jgi:thiol-disulfide isomerase/thioredoxin
MKSAWIACCWIVLGQVTAMAQQVGTSGLTAEEIKFWRRQTALVIGSNERRQELLDKITEKFPNGDDPEVLKMLRVILTKGPAMGGSDGWFGPSQRKHDWNWLRQFHQVPATASIDKPNFLGSEKLFLRLDRNLDGVLNEADFDWSEQSPWVRQASILNRVYRVMDADGDNRVTSDEMDAFDKKLRAENENFSMEEFRNAVLAAAGGYVPGDEPSPEKLLRGLFNGELGSIHQGPNLGDDAPDFTLTTQDGTQTITLGEQHAAKPVVLVFGNFTCGPYRRAYPEIEDIHQRFKDSANFLAIYVREAHPDDGWAMQSNRKLGVSVTQPKTFEERVSIAKQCQQKLNYTMPLLVDQIDDTVGNAYSGMPARLYVIDRQGKIVYKGGRGPFGFNSGEMEQALAMTLLEQENSKP